MISKEQIPVALNRQSVVLLGYQGSQDIPLCIS